MITNRRNDPSVSSFTAEELNVMSGQWEKVTRVYSSSSPHLYFNAELYDVESNKMVWIASAHTKESVSTSGGVAVHAGFGTMVKSFADTAIKKLQEEGLLN
jgi:hypothetical protein